MASPDKNRLADELNGARNAIDGTLAGWRRRLDIGARVRMHPNLSVTAGVAGGFVLGHWWPRRPIMAVRPTGRVGPHPVVAVLRTALTLGRPVLSAYFASQRSGPVSAPADATAQSPDPSTP